MVDVPKERLALENGMIPEEWMTTLEKDVDDELDPRIRESNSQTSPIEELENFLVDPQDPSKMLQVGNGLTLEAKEKLKNFLRRNLDVFP